MKIINFPSRFYALLRVKSFLAIMAIFPMLIIGSQRAWVPSNVLVASGQNDPVSGRWKGRYMEVESEPGRDDRRNSGKLFLQLEVDGKKATAYYLTFCSDFDSEDKCRESLEEAMDWGPSATEKGTWENGSLEAEDKGRYCRTTAEIKSNKLVGTRKCDCRRANRPYRATSGMSLCYDRQYAFELTRNGT